MEDSNEEQEEVEQYMKDINEEPNVVEEHGEERDDVEQQKEESNLLLHYLRVCVDGRHEHSHFPVSVTWQYHVLHQHLILKNQYTDFRITCHNINIK